MTAAERILLRLDAHECWGSKGRSRPPATLDPVVVSRGPPAVFGTVLGAQSIAELQDLISVWTYRMQQLGQAYGDFSPTWVARDSMAFVDWTNDWVRLQNRYSAALKNAQSAVTLSRLSFATPASLIPAQAEFTALAKAMRQCYPPDGCPVVKGDWSDLFDRLTLAAKGAGAQPPADNPPQPVARDVDIQAFAATAPVDVVAQATGAQKGGPLPLGASGWLSKHKTALVVGGVILAGGVALAYLGPMMGLAAKSAKGLAMLTA
jgi:hypothetical protein